MTLVILNSLLFRLDRLRLHGCALRGTVLLVVRTHGRKCRQFGSGFARHAEWRETKQGALVGQQSDSKITPIQTARGVDLPTRSARVAWPRPFSSTNCLGGTHSAISSIVGYIILHGWQSVEGQSLAHGIGKGLTRCRLRALHTGAE